MPNFNQNYTPSWNMLYQSLLNKVTKTIITANVYQSPFSQMLQELEVGETVEDIHINPGAVMLQDTITNSDIFTNYVDDIATALYSVNVDLVFPSTYIEYVVREGFTILENVTSLLTSLTANIRTTVEYQRNELVKQMLYNAYQYGMLDSKVISDPTLGKDEAGYFAIAINTMIDDFRTEINSRNVIYNNQIGLSDDEKRKTITRELPYVIVFNNYIRYAEFTNTLNLSFGTNFMTGNSNQDWASRIIKLNEEDFPKSIPPIDRDTVTGNNVSAKNINFYPMPRDENDEPLFSGEPKGGDTILAFVIDPSAIKLFTQLQVMTYWQNPATLAATNREIYRGIMELGAFNKINVITCNKGQTAPLTIDMIDKMKKVEKLAIEQKETATK